VHSETDASLASSWNCRHWATGLEGRQAARSRPSDRRRRTPDGRASCDDVVVRRGPSRIFKHHYCVQYFLYRSISNTNTKYL